MLLNYTPTMQRLRQERREKRSQIGRYHQFHVNGRLSLEEHIAINACLLKEVWPLLPTHLLDQLSLATALEINDSHDDPEIVTGDIPAASKHVMSEEDEAEHERRESEGIEIVTERYGPLIGKNRYRKNIYAYKNASVPEAPLVIYMDKISTCGEGFHYLFNGSTDITINKMSKDGELELVPFQLFPVVTRQKVAKYPLLQEIIGKGLHPLLELVNECNYRKLVKHRPPHARESIWEPTGITLYDAWKLAILRHYPGEPSFLWDNSPRTFPNRPAP